MLLSRIDAVAVAGTGMPEERFLKRAEVDETFAREVSTCGLFADVLLFVCVTALMVFTYVRIP